MWPTSRLGRFTAGKGFRTHCGGGAGWLRIRYDDPPSQKICTSEITTPSLLIPLQLPKLTADVNENDKNYSNSKILMARFEVLRDVEDLGVMGYDAVVTGK